MTSTRWTPPQSGTGRASILPPPHWHDSGEVIAVDFTADPSATGLLHMRAARQGAAEIELAAREFEEIDAPAPTVIGDGWTLAMAFSVSGGTAISFDGAPQ